MKCLTLFLIVSHSLVINFSFVQIEDDEIMEISQWPAVKEYVNKFLDSSEITSEALRCQNKGMVRSEKLRKEYEQGCDAFQKKYGQDYEGVLAEMGERRIELFQSIIEHWSEKKKQGSEVSKEQLKRAVKAAMKKEYENRLAD